MNPHSRRHRHLHSIDANVIIILILSMHDAAASRSLDNNLDDDFSLLISHFIRAEIATTFDDVIIVEWKTFEFHRLDDDVDGVEDMANRTNERAKIEGRKRKKL